VNLDYVEEACAIIILFMNNNTEKKNLNKFFAYLFKEKEIFYKSSNEPINNKNENYIFSHSKIIKDYLNSLRMIIKLLTNVADMVKNKLINFLDDIESITSNYHNFESNFYNLFQKNKR